MSGPSDKQPNRAVVIAACRSGRERDSTGSDSALLAALLFQRHDELTVIRSGPWSPDPVTIGGCRVNIVRPPAGRPGNAGGVLRRINRAGPMPVWAEAADLARLRGFDRAAQSVRPEDMSRAAMEQVFGNAAAGRSPTSEPDATDEVLAVVLGSHAHRLDARGVVYAASIAAVTGQPIRVVVPRGTRNVDSARRYARRLHLPLRLETTDAPTWLVLDGADAVILDRDAEASTSFGPLLGLVAERLGLPVIDLPGTLPVGERNARRFGLPVLDALGRQRVSAGATVG